ncbi:MAG: ABC transporter permease [Dehalococcoidales bacterium]
MNNLRGVYTIWYRDLIRFWHDKIRMVGSLAMPFLFLFVFARGLSASMMPVGSGTDFTQFMFPGVIGMAVLIGSFMGGVSVVWDREFGFLKEVLVAPISRASVAVGKTLGAATIALLQGSLILSFAPLVGVSLSVQTVLMVLPLMFLLAASMGSFGVLMATRIRTIEAFYAVTQMLMFPMVFLSGAFFPLRGLPGWMNVLMKINPATYGITPIRQVILGASPESPFGITLFGHTMSLWNNVAVLAVFGVIATLLAIWSFTNQEQFSMAF